MWVETVIGPRLRGVVIVEVSGGATLFREGVCIWVLAGVSMTQSIPLRVSIICVELVPLSCRLYWAGELVWPAARAHSSCLHEW